MNFSFWPEQATLAPEAVARDLVRRGLGVPAVFVLETMKPFSVVTQQTLIATSPLAQICGYGRLFGQLLHLFEERSRMEDLILEVERHLEIGNQVEDGPARDGGQA